MKKILSLALLLMCALCTNAQQRKTWDFTTGPSDETVANLEADANWTVSYNDDGTFKQAVDAAKMSGELTANGVVIEELRGLRLGTGGLSGSSNYIIGSNKFRLSRNNEQLILRVVPGQTITMKARSANATATNRGFKGDDNMEYTSGPTDGVCPGGNIEADGRDERGDFTLVWKVKEDAVPTLDGDSLDVTITASPAGGLDISLVQIDEGDNPSKTTVDVAYIYDSTYPEYDADGGDIAYQILTGVLAERIEGLAVKPIDASGEVSEELTREALEYYDLVVVGNSVRGDNQYAGALKDAIAYTPMLVFTPNLYEAWGYGKAQTTETGVLDIPESARSNALFESSDPLVQHIDENGQLLLLDGSTIVGYTAEEGSIFANDNVLATAGGVNAIHIHNSKRNAYMMLPYPYKMSPGDAIEDVIPNAAVMLRKTKAEVTQASKPVISQEYHNMYTTVSLASTTSNHKIYYTIDGSDPTTESTLYSEPFDVTEENVTVKAIVTAEGYLQSDVREQTISIYAVSAAPTVSLAKESGKTVITLVPGNDNDVIYYNFRSSSDTTMCSRYDEPVEVTKHVTLTAFAGQFAEDGTFLKSETVSEFVEVQDEKVRLDVIGHFDGNSDDWSSLKTTAYNFYTEELDHVEEGVDEDGNPTTTNVYKPANELTVVDPGNGWEFKTYGQAGLYQNNTITNNVFNFDGYNPQTAWDDSEGEATSRCVQFGGRGKNFDGETDPASACIQSTTLYQAPFDVVTYVSGYNATGKVYVSADTTDVNSWIEIGSVIGGTIKGTATNGKDGSSRIWRKAIASYEGTGLVAVKVASESGTLNIFDIYVKNYGELSAAYTGIEEVKADKNAEGGIVSTMIYNINGTRIGTVAKGINIVKDVYANGVVKTRKVVVK